MLKLLEEVNCHSVTSFHFTHWWHDRITLVISNISKRHFRAFVLVDFQLWEVNVWNLIQLD